MSPASWFFNLSALAIFMGVLSVFGFLNVNWSSGAVTLRGLPLIRRTLCFLATGRIGKWRMVSELHARSPKAHSVFGTGALLLCQPSELVRVAGVAPATSSFRTRPSAADITP